MNPSVYLSCKPSPPFVRFTCISNVSWSAPGCSGSAPSCVSFPKDLPQKMVENPYESTNSSWWLNQPNQKYYIYIWSKFCLSSPLFGDENKKKVWNHQLEMITPAFFIQFWILGLRIWIETTPDSLSSPTSLPCHALCIHRPSMRFAVLWPHLLMAFAAVASRTKIPSYSHPRF